ncbi:unnamed protein product [Linum trigynum]|uniref:Uncharacterized protein n=1 Tax=Linum trigynum TaxID=586398 RepID=A0AAV2F312_9ROSI
MRAPLVNLPYGVAAGYNGTICSSNGGTEVGISHNDDHELRRGPWTLEEDTLLSHYIARHGEGRWNMLAKCAGLKRTGKSCRLRWLNYLKPDIKRGNLTPKEQLLILELHSKWGNRWSRIAQHLPGRTDNEIKNYWRTRVQRQARQLNIESNSKRFLDAVRCYWMPRLLQKVEQQQTFSSSSDGQLPTSSTMPADQNLHHQVAAVESGSLSPSAADHTHFNDDDQQLISNPYSNYPLKEETHFSNSTSVNGLMMTTAALSTDSTTMSYQQNPEAGKILESEYVGFSMENCNNWNMILGDGTNYHDQYYEEISMVDPLMAAAASASQSTADHELCQVGGDDSNWVGYSYDVSDTLWNLDDTWQYRGV